MSIGESQVGIAGEGQTGSSAVDPSVAMAISSIKSILPFNDGGV